ncbi:hypothetical protein [Cellulomonas composti]|uniref:Uncharacterized protein n=1 Tax=Cellulomonas composti TaxID=266130 RepID=A0A511J6T2_9CELL|nr:hypothetical protein [Cellulomonas composti]GEL93701.1 hypothetical protein CCO02nite_03590 [Cellulomonas composti]
MLLTWVLVGFLALAAFISGRWYLRQYDGLGRRRPFPRISVVLCLLVALGCAIPVVVHVRLEHQLQAAAEQVAGVPVEVRCQTIGQTFVDATADLGYVKWGPDGEPERKTLISWEPCQDLRAWLGSDKSAPSLDQVVAVHVLTHEAMHMSGIKNESHAECAAVQRDEATAQALGADPDQARALAKRYWTEVYPRMPDGYRGGCGPEGRYDEELSTAPW